tara:strand:+ start:806 stop:1183 length:378 start_codon:yes stop_codon:yes gene_type:complete
MINKKNFPNLLFCIFFIFLIFLISHRSGFDLKLLKNFYKVNYGYDESMTIYKRYHFHANEIKKLVKKYKILEFNIDSELLGDPFIFESSYPSKYNKNSKFYFSKKELNNCILIENATKINLFKCK